MTPGRLLNISPLSIPDAAWSAVGIPFNAGSLTPAI